MVSKNDSSLTIFNKKMTKEHNLPNPFNVKMTKEHNLQTLFNEKITKELNSLTLFNERSTKWLYLPLFFSKAPVKNQSTGIRFYFSVVNQLRFIPLFQIIKYQMIHCSH